ncbi:related to peroxisomal membrane protein [Ustilago trichophora]|uniref:Putative peroxiredoxin n=1 Tax=Ustilago trichophora TaxID=86804 RepID=A0A5C3E2Y4_9BASI|nr:related to peroxisomal membrane protein [Ustilago trichophora]
MVSKLFTSVPAIRAAAFAQRSSMLPAAASGRLISSLSSSSSATLSLPPQTLRTAPTRTAAGLNGFAASPIHKIAMRTMATTAARQQAISKGDQIPNTTFMYVPWAPELADGTACGAPTKFQTHEAFKGKKIVIVAVPGAYTPTCHVNHIPPYIKQVDAFKSKGVDQIIVLAQNDPFVMSAWGVQNKAEDKVIFATDLNLEFSKGIGSTADLSAMGFGERTGRYALIVDDLKVVDFSSEPNPGAVEVSGADHVLAKL